MIKEVHKVSIGGISASKTRLKFIQTVAFNKKKDSSCLYTVFSKMLVIIHIILSVL